MKRVFVKSFFKNKHTLKKLALCFTKIEWKFQVFFGLRQLKSEKLFPECKIYLIKKIRL